MLFKRLSSFASSLKTAKTVGSAGRRRYDLPLARSAGSGFLVLLVGMMTLLAVLALAASFLLGALGDRWTSGLEGKATIEIPATGADGKLVPRDRLDGQARRIAEYLRAQSAIASAEILDKNDVAALVGPWLGQGASADDIPLPVLIALEIKEGDSEKLAAFEKRIRAIAPQARIDTHAQWLSGILRLVGALGFAAALMVGLTALSTVVAVAGGVRSRMAEHRSDIEILHLMGSGDSYIARQFQRHAGALALKGSLGGLAAAALAIVVIGALSGDTRESILPDFSLSAFDIAAMAAVVPAAIGIAWLAARWSVLKALADMP